MPVGQVAALRAAAEAGPDRAVAAVVALAARARGLDTALVVDGEMVPPDPAVMAADVDDDVLFEQGPWLPGMVRESITDPLTRRRSGVHHTSPEVTDTVLRLAFEGHDLASVTIGDPSVGGGVFLLAAAELLLASSVSRSEVIGRLCGVDVDPLAVAVTRAALELWAGSPADGSRIVESDFIASWPFADSRTDIVVGNPPFLGQLKARTARAANRAAMVNARWSDVGGYVDDAVLFLLAGLETVPPGGTVALLQPVSMLSARDAGPVRRRILSDGIVAGFWHDEGRVFEAGVDTCAVVIRKHAAEAQRTRGPVRRLIGASGRAAKDHPPITGSGSWASLVADLVGVPSVPRPDGVMPLGDIARCTAGFRDQYYGLREAVREDPRGDVRLVTSGLIDPLVCRWGAVACRFDRRRWTAPTVDLSRVEPSVAGWVRERLRPKIVVASQTRVIEAAVDTRGSWLPCTPVISVEPRPDAPSLWHIVSALSAPQATAWLAADTAGSALSRDALRVSASRLAGLPLPPNGPRWDAAADAARAAHRDPRPERICLLAEAAARAYGEPDPGLLDWYSGRLPAHGG